MTKFKRKKFLTDKKYQLKYTSVIMLAMLIVAIVISGTLYWDVSRTLTTEKVNELMQWDKYIIRVVLLLFAAFLGGIFLSHKIVGPIQRIENSLKKINNGEFDVDIKLREGDEFIKISDEINNIASKLKSLSEKRPELKDEFKVS